MLGTSDLRFMCFCIPSKASNSVGSFLYRFYWCILKPLNPLTWVRIRRELWRRCKKLLLKLFKQNTRRKQNRYPMWFFIFGTTGFRSNLKQPLTAFLVRVVYWWQAWCLSCLKPVAAAMLKAECCLLFYAFRWFRHACVHWWSIGEHYLLPA